MNFSQALEALNQGEAVTNGNPINDGYIVMYEMKDKSIGDRLIIHQYPGRVKHSVFELTQQQLLSNHWRIIKETEL
jgi:hypothetical protein